MFEFVLHKSSPVRQRHMSPELRALVHTQSPLLLSDQGWFLATCPCSMVSQASLSLPTHHPFPEIRSHKDVTSVWGEAHI